MPPTTVHALIDLLTLPARERAGELCGAALARLNARAPRVTRLALRALERAGVRGMGWALVALELGADHGR